MRTIDKKHVVRAFASSDQLGETPLWCEREGKVWWLDIERPTLHALDPQTGVHESRAYDCTYLGSLALTESGKKLVAMDLDLHVLDHALDPAAHLARVESGLDNRLNDGRVDAQGRLWIGTMDNGLREPNGGLYRVDVDGTTYLSATDVVVSNGIAFSPDGTRLYFTDTRRYTSYVFDVDLDDGRLTNRRVFADYTHAGDRPDGACVDVDGCLWQAFFAGKRIVRYTPEGVIDTVIEVPVTNPTCVCFGGPDLRTLYITTARKFIDPDQLAAEPWAGSLLAVEGVGQGLPENRFAI
jgi:sugar lactone lactonase YvrE